MTEPTGTIESHSLDVEVYPPSAEFTAQANLNDPAIYWQAAENPEAYWADRARELHWTKPFTQTLDWSNPPFAKWFQDGELNVAANCLDRHVANGLADRVAFHFEGEPGDTRTITYGELTHEVKRTANMLTALGVKAGDRVAIYMPLIPETIIAMLAVARLGAAHSVVFGGFSAESLRSRLDDAQAELIITADGGYRKGRVSALKPTVDDALALAGDGRPCSVEKVLVVKRCGNEIAMQAGRDLWWEDEITAYDGEHAAQGFPAENPLFILYTSGTTGKPKGILHTSGGYLTQVAATHRDVFDLKPESDVFWCTADIGWVTGHTYISYGPLALGGTEIVFEGVPTYPDAGRFWKMIERHKVTVFYTAPTAIRSLIKAAESNEAVHPKRYDLSSLRILGSVGEPINPAAWEWYHANVGGGRCPIVDTWWQTETGGHMITPLPGATPLVPGSCTLPFPGIDAAVVDETGKEVPNGQGGILVVRKPWPGMIRTIWGDPDRYRKSYWPEDFKGRFYLAGDGATRDATTGYFTITGRIDDVLNVSGHRMGTMEIESALVSCTELVAEAAVVGRPDDTTGEAICAFVVLKRPRPTGDEAKAIAKQLRDWVGKEIGPIA
ncbi:MAG: acetate--CoA ligase, partial [Leucobacter sp.]|nr:acetate--CoA ligase [Leucobacter sp.]